MRSRLYILLILEIIFISGCFLKRKQSLICPVGNPQYLESISSNIIDYKLYSTRRDSLYLTGTIFDKVTNDSSYTYEAVINAIVAYKKHLKDSTYKEGVNTNLNGEYRLSIKEEFSLVSYIGFFSNKLTIQNLNLQKGDSLVINVALGQANLTENEAVYDYNNGDITLLK